MLFKTKKEDLKAVLNAISGIPVKDNTSVQSHLLFILENKSVYVMAASRYCMGYKKLVVELGDGKDCKFTVNAKNLKDFVDTANEDIEFSYYTDKVMVTSGKTSFHLQSFTPDKFFDFRNDLESETPLATFELPAPIFINILKSGLAYTDDPTESYDFIDLRGNYVIAGFMRKFFFSNLNIQLPYNKSIVFDKNVINPLTTFFKAGENPFNIKVYNNKVFLSIDDSYFAFFSSNKSHSDDVVEKFVNSDETKNRAFKIDREALSTIIARATITESLKSQFKVYKVDNQAFVDVITFDKTGLPLSQNQIPVEDWIYDNFSFMCNHEDIHTALKSLPSGNKIKFVFFNKYFRITDDTLETSIPKNKVFLVYYVNEG